jgi:hypothetical protein
MGSGRWVSFESTHIEGSIFESIGGAIFRSAEEQPSANGC